MRLAPAEVVSAGLCIGCGACAARRAAAPGSLMAWDRYGQLKPSGSWTHDADGAFASTCPFSPAARDEDAIAAERFADALDRDDRIGRFQAAFVGHAREQSYRPEGSSGGMVTWMAAELLRHGLIDGVAHVVPVDPASEGRFFRYRISRGIDALREGARSRYYPVEMSGIIDEIRSVPGRYAIVGVPCFIKAVHLLRSVDDVLRQRIAYTLGLFCGHMKSARLVESFAWQLDAPMREVRAVEYRRKDPNRPANWYTAHLDLADGGSRWRDWWHLADGDWGAGFFQNSACDYCDDVVAETADVSFGDAWVEPYSLDGKGTHVAIVRNRELLALIEAAREEGRLDLQPVGADFVADTQAAGLRHRREGLAYRLAIAPPRLSLRKRVAAGRGLPWRRRMVYRIRRAIATHSHLIFALSRRWGMPVLYLAWARTMLRIYQAFAYSRGPLGKAVAMLSRSTHA